MSPWIEEKKEEKLRDRPKKDLLLSNNKPSAIRPTDEIETCLPRTKRLTVKNLRKKNHGRRHSINGDDDHTSTNHEAGSLETVPFQSFHQSILNHHESAEETKMKKRSKKKSERRKSIARLEGTSLDERTDVFRNDKIKEGASKETTTPGDTALSFLQRLELENQKRTSRSTCQNKPWRQPSSLEAASTKKMPPSFLESLERQNRHRKQKEKSTEHQKRIKVKQRSNPSGELTETIQKKLSQRKIKKKPQPQEQRQEKHAPDLAMEEFDFDSTIAQIDWFSMSLRDSNLQEEDVTPPPEENVEDEKKKKPKQMRSSVEYSFPKYQFTTRKEMQEMTYYLKMIVVKRRHINISNLFANEQLVSNLYNSLDLEVLFSILDPRRDAKWIHEFEKRYLDDDDDYYGDCDKYGSQEGGMEVLSIFFGPNRIDKDPDNEGHVDDSFSVVSSVESVHFDSDNENDEDYFQGVPRERVEVMPGNFSILRKEEETYDAISNGNYMSSLCLGCGVALVSVQDALEVACPNCGSITPLNGICLRRPFGIATGIKRVKCEHLLAPRKSPFTR